MNAAGAGTVTYIPAGTYRVHDVNIPSNTELEVDSGATIKHYGTNNGALFSLQGVQNTNFAQDVYVRGVDGRFTVDLVDGGSGITAFRVRSVEGFSIENVDIINQADGHTGDTLKPNISFLPMDTTKLNTKWEHARNGLIKNAHAFDAAHGWGLTQLTGAENVHFENISSEGGSALRVENFETNATTIDRITADGVTCTNGKNPVNFNPHQAVNGTVSVTNVRADSCSEVIRFGWDSAYNTGDFSDIDITGAEMIAGTMVQIRTGLNTWEYGNSTRCVDADANLPYASSVTITSLDCGGLPHKNWPR